MVVRKKKVGLVDAPIDASITSVMAVQMAMRCQDTVTSRSKKKPSDAFAMAIPTMAKPCPIHSYKVA